ncbi:MAG: hypothetical protein ACFFC1_16990 [Promethearchaeota archaeon]
MGFLIILLILIDLMSISFEPYKRQNTLNTSHINLSADGKEYQVTLGHPYTWINISSGTELLLGDNDFTLTTLPFNFTFYDGYYNEIYITTEGYLTFSFKSVQTNPNIPSSHPHRQKIIAPYWTDLDGTSGKIYVKNFSSYWVAAWENFNLDNTSFAGTFEAILYNSGDIIFNYDILENIGTHACGLNYGDGNNYTSYTNLTSGINDFSIKFSLTSIDGSNDVDGSLPSNVINTIVIVVVTVGIVSAVGGITLYFYKKNPEQFKARLSRTKARFKDGTSKLKKKFKEKVSKVKNSVKTKTPKEEKKT